MKRTAALLIAALIAMINVICTLYRLYPNWVSWIVSGIIILLDAYFLGELNGEIKSDKRWKKFIEEHLFTNKEKGNVENNKE